MVTQTLNATPKKGKKAKPEWHSTFLRVLAVCANVGKACTAVKVDRKTAYRHRKLFPSFAKAWDDAIEQACDSLELIARTRAQRSSDTLMIFLLKAHRPAKYRENLRIQHAGHKEQRIIVESNTPRPGDKIE